MIKAIYSASDWTHCFDQYSYSLFFFFFNLYVFRFWKPRDTSITYLWSGLLIYLSFFFSAFGILFCVVWFHRFLPKRKVLVRRKCCSIKLLIRFSSWIEGERETQLNLLSWEKQIAKWYVQIRIFQLAN